jgi:hypothetical protein
MYVLVCVWLYAMHVRLCSGENANCWDKLLKCVYPSLGCDWLHHGRGCIGAVKDRGRVRMRGYMLDDFGWLQVMHRSVLSPDSLGKVEMSMRR